MFHFYLTTRFLYEYSIIEDKNLIVNLYEIIFLKNLYSIIASLLILALCFSFFTYSIKLKRLSVLKDLLLYFFAFVISIYLGFREYSVGTDSESYKYLFEYHYSLQDSFVTSRDFLWDLFNFIVAQVTDEFRIIFLLTAFAYIYLPLIGIRKYLNNNTIYFFILFLISPNFFLYGANGIRSGLAASVLLLSFRYYNHKSYKQYTLMAIGSLIHISMAVPSVLFFCSKYIKTLKFPLLLWIILLTISISGVNLLDYFPETNRLGGYVDSDILQATVFDKLINFFVYSISPILLGFYVLFIRNIYDVFYKRLLITYILSNCFYVMALNSPYSVRFAYLSEFLLPFLLVYPLFKFKLWRYLEIKVSIIFIFIFLIKSYKIIII